MNLGLTLGEYIAKLKSLPADADIELDFGGAVPTKLYSYRGYYNELALGYDGTYGASLPTVKQLLEDATAANGSTFTGWKGGSYTMRDSTSIFVANPGNTSETYIKDIVEKLDSWYVIKTVSEIEEL